MLQTLIVDDDNSSASLLGELVAREGYSASMARSLAEARRSLRESPPDVVVLDLRLPDGDGMDLMEDLDELGSCPAVVILTGHASVATAVEALRSGASDYLTKPLDVDRFKSILAHCARTLRLQEEITLLRDELRSCGRFGKLVGESRPMQRLYDLIARVAPTDATVLLVGESGTGKELAAETICRLSKRQAGPFVALNCGAVSPNLIESELFGHVRGSFTGATRSHRGIFERANGGTLFLDEITEMPIELQVKLLRALETSTIVPVGSDEAVEIDARVIAATNRDPRAAVEDGLLREDLYYRLQVFPIDLPPLRDRRSDIRLLCATFLRQMNSEYDREKSLSEDTIEALESHSWPGNVRELRNVLNRAYIMADETIDVELLEFTPAHGARRIEPDHANDGASNGKNPRIDVHGTLADAERTLVFAALEKTGGNKKDAAKNLGISLRTLYNRLREYGATGSHSREVLTAADRDAAPGTRDCD